MQDTKEWLRAHRKKERQIVKDPKAKALRVIDMLLTNAALEDKLSSTIFRIAHSASGICDNEHQSWRAEIDTLYKQLRKT